jgi:hypothetical protein
VITMSHILRLPEARSTDVFLFCQQHAKQPSKVLTFRYGTRGFRALSRSLSSVQIALMLSKQRCWLVPASSALTGRFRDGNLLTLQEETMHQHHGYP